MYQRLLYNARLVSGPYSPTSYEVRNPVFFFKFPCENFATLKFFAILILEVLQLLRNSEQEAQGLWISAWSHESTR